MAEQNRDMVVIGGSAGGVEALRSLIGSLPADLPAAVFVVLHVLPQARSALQAILQRVSRIPVVEARHGARIERGHVYVAAPDFHLFVEGDRLLVLRGPKENRARPAINPLFRSAARAYRGRVIGVILTGLLDDGAAGLWAVQQFGGVTIVQSDPAFAEMPNAAAEFVQVDHRVPLAEIGPLLGKLTRETISECQPSDAAAEVLRMEDDAARATSVRSELDQWGGRTTLTCPDCGGALWYMNQGVPEYRCHTGHSFTARSLAKAVDSNLEDALWSALRALEQSAMIDNQLAARAAEHQLETAAGIYRANEAQKLGQAERLRHFIVHFAPEK